MKENEKETDRLTRLLIKETVEQPPSGMNGRIMAMIMKNAPAKSAFRLAKTISPVQILVLFTVYMLIIAAAILSFRGQKTDMSELTGFLKDIFPVFLTVAGSISFFILFGLLDEWLKQREHNTSEK